MEKIKYPLIFKHYNIPGLFNFFCVWKKYIWNSCSGPQKKVKLLKMPLTKDEQKQVKDEDEASNVKKKKAKNKFKVQVDEVSSSSDNNSASFTKDYQPRNKLLIKCSGKWFDHKVFVLIPYYNTFH